MNKKKIAIIVSASLLILVLGISATLAYFTDAENQVNKFTTAGNDDDEEGTDIEIEEPNWPGDQEDVYPGDAFPKDPTIHNIKGESYARIAVVFREHSDDPDVPGAIITDSARVAAIWNTILYSTTYDPANPSSVEALKAAQLAASAINPHFNSTDFTDVTTTHAAHFGPEAAGIKIFDYKSPTSTNIMAHDVRATLFNFVVIPSDWDVADIDLAGNFDIDVQGQAIQVKNVTPTLAATTLNQKLCTDLGITYIP